MGVLNGFEALLMFHSFSVAKGLVKCSGASADLLQTSGKLVVFEVRRLQSALTAFAEKAVVVPTARLMAL